MLRYLDTPYARHVPEPPAVWSRGSARLLDYGAQGGGARPLVLFVPSLINRYYILDLEEEQSLLRYLAAQGCRALVLDWGAPGEPEKNFGCDDYVGVLTAAIDFLHRASGRKVHLAGYCMGGVLAVAAAQLRQKKLASLALLATPWDFHCKPFAPMILSPQWRQVMDGLLAGERTLPADIIQSLFYVTDPFVFEHKFRRFAGLADGSRAAKNFVALERWVNDGVPMTAQVARDCLVGWVQENQLDSGQWTVDKKRIDPAKIKLPTLLAIPKNDHVVPHDCAMALARRMKSARVIHPGAGHVGMIVGHKAKQELWQPLATWLLHPRRTAGSGIKN